MRLTPRRAAVSGAVLAVVMVGAAVLAVGSAGTSAGARALVGVPSLTLTLTLGPAAGAPAAPAIEPASWLQTPERYLGAATSAGTLAAGPVPVGQTVQRDDPDPANDEIALRGRVTGEEQDVVLAPGASALLRYTARDVYAVLAPGAGGTAEVEVRLDGRPVPAGRRGPSLRVLPNGTTVADVGDEDLRHLLTAAEGAEDPGALTLVARGAPVRLFTITFGA